MGSPAQIQLITPVPSRTRNTSFCSPHDDRSTTIHHRSQSLDHGIYVVIGQCHVLRGRDMSPRFRAPPPAAYSPHQWQDLETLPASNSYLNELRRTKFFHWSLRAVSDATGPRGLSLVKVMGNTEKSWAFTKCHQLTGLLRSSDAPSFSHIL